MAARFRASHRDDDAGFTLIELLVTVTIMSLAFVIILGAIAVFMRSTGVQRASAKLDGAMRSYAEKLDYEDGAACPSPTSYPSPTDLGVQLPDGVTGSVSAVKCWDGTKDVSLHQFQATNPNSEGVQQLTVTMQFSSGQQESLVVVKRHA